MAEEETQTWANAGNFEEERVCRRHDAIDRAFWCEEELTAKGAKSAKKGRSEGVGRRSRERYITVCTGVVSAVLIVD